MGLVPGATFDLHEDEDGQPRLELPPGECVGLPGVTLPASHHAVAHAALVTHTGDGRQRGLQPGDQHDLLARPVCRVQDAVQSLQGTLSQ